jgi:hypothetical protein
MKEEKKDTKPAVKVKDLKPKANPTGGAGRQAEAFTGKEAHSKHHKPGANA